MPEQPSFDIRAAHRYFSAECFNRAWDLIENPDRTPQENEEMIRLAMASLYHWTQREDCTPTNYSISYWQLSRIYSLLNQVDNARHYGEICLETSQGEGILPFYLGYAYEALARAEAIAGDAEKMAAYLENARQIAERIPDPGERKQLLDDLSTIN